MPDNEKHLYKEDICLLYKKFDLNEEAVNIIKSFHAKFKVKSLTKEGQELKKDEQVNCSIKNQNFS